MKVDMNDLFELFTTKLWKVMQTVAGLMSYNFFAGEPVVGFDEGRPLFVRMPDNKVQSFKLHESKFICISAVQRSEWTNILKKKEKVVVD